MKKLLIHLILVITSGFGLHGILEPQVSGFEEFGIYLALFYSLGILSYLINRKYFRQFWRGNLLVMYFLKELIISNLQIIYYVVTPGLQFRPAIVCYELSLKSDVGITLLANLITLTPGTLTLDVSADRKYLFFHSLSVPNNDLEVLREKIRNGFEKRIMALTE